MDRTTEPTAQQRHRLFWLVLAITLILLGWALHATSAFTIPIAFAFFVAIAIAPVDYRVRESLPSSVRWLGHLVSMLILIVLLGLFFAGIGLAARQVLEKFPGSLSQDVGQVVEATTQKQQTGGQPDQPEQPQTEGDGGQADQMRGQEADGGNQAPGSAQASGQSSQGQRGAFSQLTGTRADLGELLRERATSYADTVVNRTATFFLSLALVLFLALFMLIEGPKWEQKARKVLSRERGDEWLNAVRRTAAGVRWFVVVRAALGLITAFLYVGWLAIMGVDLLFVWGLITFLLNFVPTIGSVISGVLAAGYAFYQLGPGQAAIVGIGLFVIEQVMGNYVDPRFLGRQLALSGFVVLVFLLIWGWIWGIAGALLATPILIFIVSVAAHIPALRPLAILLSEKGEESVQKIDSSH